MTDDLTKHLWLPYTQMKISSPPLEAVATEGSTIRLQDGRELVDGIASWWTACHGYNHPHIAEAVTRQLQQMPHVMFGGLVHEPAAKLATRLAKLAPGDLTRVFFSDSGSVAVEVAMKMAVQFWLNKGPNKDGVGRSHFVHFRDSYHGDTMGCMALADPEEGMHVRFKDWLPQQLMAELPRDNGTAKAFEDLLKREQEQIAAVIVEPLVQGAGGMKFHDASVLKRVADICAQNNVLLIADEVFTGFGRTGTMFACEQAGVVPDILCLGKALTGGAMTLAATLARQHVFDAFWSDDADKALMHGPTYMANPLACAAADASLDLFETEPRLQQVAAIEQALRAGLEPCRNMKNIKDVRVLGAIGVVQMDAGIDVAKLKPKFVERGVWVRPYRDIIYLTPAFTIGADELKQLTDTVCEVVKEI